MVPQTMSRYLSFYYLLILKKEHSSLSTQKKFLRGPFGDFGGLIYPQTRSQYLSFKFLLIAKKKLAR